MWFVDDRFLPQEYATTRENTCSTVALPSLGTQDVLTQVLREGAQRMLAQAIESEVAEWIDTHSRITTETGHQGVVRNGYLPKRAITTGLGPIAVRQPLVLDRRPGVPGEERFSSSTFATVRLRHRKTKGNGTRRACLAMVYKLMQSAAKRWRTLNGSKHLPDVIAGIKFDDGIKSQAAA